MTNTMTDATERTCKGMNCTASAQNNYAHSTECRFEHAAAVASGVKSVSYGCTVSDKCTYIEWRGQRIELDHIAARLAQKGEPVAVVVENTIGVEIVWVNPPPAIRPPVGTKLYTAPQPPALPDGWQLVPKEPTREMKNAGGRYKIHCAVTGEQKTVGGYYRAMLAAAPTLEAQ